MKNFKIMCISILLLGLMAGPALAQISYCKDVLEPGNPGGLGTCDIVGGACSSNLDCFNGAFTCLNPSLKTFDETWDFPNGESIGMDIWHNDVPEPLLTGGCFITYDPSLLEITNVIPFDTDNGGPWDAGFTSSFLVEPGQWFLSLGQFSCVAPDGDGDIILGQATILRIADGNADITISTIPGFDTVTGCEGFIYDPQISPNVVALPGVAGCVPEECDDGVYCNGAETCVADVCEPGTPPTCDDGVSCTDDMCDTGQDICVNTPNDGACDDGFFCNGIETCDAVSDCLDGTPPDCNDGVDCTVDTCDEIGDVCDNTPDDLVCDNGDVCDGAETCDPVNDCQAGDPLVCDDGNLCTTDSCDALDGCIFTPVECGVGLICDPADGLCKEAPCTGDEQCDDGIFCNGAETCDTGTGNCQNGTPPDCDDGVGCTSDMCDTGLDDCVNTPDDGACDDADVCTGTETCDPLNDCQAGDPLICDDGNLCTTDGCDPVAGCVFSPVECPVGETCDPADGQCKSDVVCDPELCDDGLYCNGTETCVGDVCTPGTPPDCDDGVGCTVDECNEATNMCDNTPDNGACDDADVCTGEETCDPLNDCQAGDPLICEDGDLCTTDGCDPVTGCVFSPVECPVGETCDPADGQCKPDEPGCDPEVCDDGLYCNGTETCVDDVCTPGTPPDCSDGVDCTMDSCDTGLDACVNTPNDGLCDDGNVCNGMETCDEILGCQAGTPLDCDDGVDCTDDTCDEVAGCRSAPNDDKCPGDGLYCNGEEFCDPVDDCSSTGDPCPAGTTCNEDTQSCDPDDGIMVYVDIKPGSCPNPLNVKSKGKLPAAILGSADFDVRDIDPDTILLSREGVDGGVAPIRYSYEDVGTPFEGELCDCHDYNGDGYMDMTLKFKTQELVEVLMLHDVNGLTIPLTLTGNLKESEAGTPLSGKDCIRIQGKCKGDFDCDGDVDGQDIDKLKKNFGWSQSDSSCVKKGVCEGDFDDDGDIDSTDVNAFRAVFGRSQHQIYTCAYLECSGDFDCDRDVDGQDAKKFTSDFGRSPFSAPCTGENICLGDFDGDLDCDGLDAAFFKADFGRSLLKNPCRGCVTP